MKIALLGYGRMGKTIEQIALKRGHTIVLKIEDGSDYDISKADVAIDFSIPTAAFKNITTCIQNNVPVVSGTTGWLENYEKAVTLCKEKKGAFIYASNFSLGVNIFFELNKKLANMMKSLDQYNVSMEEIHHIQKLDEPSGTAITLAEGIIENSSKNNWILGASDNRQEIGIKALRQPDVPGTHSVFYESEVDNITIKHTAHNRQGFALGAVIAAEWLQDKTGTFTMKDVLGI
ncbi:MAG: 4-hydroxy-tetrahydrodipicolinate reductase [Flavobacteriaceae bacterium]|nr:MAG: 4-hydroxy-tetrahydrodipicolinate reductase [Flavobacteriaceae bacterium]